MQGKPLNLKTMNILTGKTGFKYYVSTDTIFTDSDLGEIVRMTTKRLDNGRVNYYYTAYPIDAKPARTYKCKRVAMKYLINMRWGDI